MQGSMGNLPENPENASFVRAGNGQVWGSSAQFDKVVISKFWMWTVLDSVLLKSILYY